MTFKSYFVDYLLSFSYLNSLKPKSDIIFTNFILLIIVNLLIIKH